MRSIAISTLLSIALFACGGAVPSSKSADVTPASAPPSPASDTPTSPENGTITTPTNSVPSSPPTPPPTGPAASRDPSPASGAPAPATSAAKVAPSKISARHVLIQWMGCDHAPTSVVRTRDQALVVAKDVLKRAKSGEDFARLAIEFSDEPNAGQRGGSLGRFGHGAMVPAFETAAFALQPGEISGIVETGFGFHIIQRTE